MNDTSEPSGSPLKRRYRSAALITVASDGIGRAFATRLADEGFDLVLVARRDPALKDLALDLGTRFGVDVRVLAMDLSDPAAIPTLLAETDGSPLGLVVAAAGIGSIRPFLERDVASEINMVDLNCRSVVELSHGFGRRMLTQGRSGIVLFGSLVGFQGAPLFTSYAASKGFIQSFAAEMLPNGVSVLSVAPGPVGSGFAARAGRPMTMREGPEKVARGALSALGKRGTVRPGGLSKFLEWSLTILVCWSRVRVMGLIMKGMYREQADPGALTSAEQGRSDFPKQRRDRIRPR